MAGIPTDEPRPRTAPLPWEPFEPRCTGVETLPIPADPAPRGFIDVLRSRRSAVGGPVELGRVAELLWHAVATKGHAPAGRAGLPVEWRAAPSAGALHPISVVCIPESAEGAFFYDPREHAFRTLDVDRVAIAAANATDLAAVVGATRGCTLRLLADVNKANAAYEHATTLVLRDSGCLIATLCLCAEWLGLAACPLGFLGQPVVGALGFPEPRFRAVGAVQITSSV